MKYGTLFSTVAVLLAVTAFTRGGWHLFLLWPALSFGVVASGYFCFGPSVFGKSTTGAMSTLSLVLLLPYLLYLWSVWYVVRLFKNETPFDQLDERIYIGRRLMGHEFPSHIDHVIDLTCEFSAPTSLREASYHSFQILDGSVPSPEQLESWIADAASYTGSVYIHCAEGHGRTGLFAAALLLQVGRFQSAEDALQYVKSKRPLVRLGRRQQAMLASFRPVQA